MSRRTSEPIKPVAKVKRDYPYFTHDQFGNRVKPSGCFRTRLKFFKSDKFATLVGFIHRAKGKYMGVREEDDLPKFPCFIDPELEPEIQEGVLYDITFVFKHDSKVAVCIDAQATRFKAKIEESYLKDIIYTVEVTVGNQRFCYDPKDGAKGSGMTRLRNRQALRGKLERCNIDRKELLLADFDKAADRIDRMFRKDGYM